MNSPDRSAWLADRKTGLGGSDIAAVLGLSPYKSAVDIFLEKTNQTPDSEMNEAMYWGTVLEDVVARHYADTSGNRVQRINQMMRHPSHNWMIANIDRAIVAPGSRARVVDGSSRTIAGAAGLLECKTASAYKATDWGSDGDDEAVPIYYTAQCMHYLAVTGLEWCDIAVLIGGQKYLSKRIERDDETIRGMTELAEEFWHKHVVERRPPEPKTGEDALKLFPRDSGREIEANPKALELLARARELKEQIAALELELDGDKKKGVGGVIGDIKAWMGDAAYITIDGAVLASWKAGKAPQRFDKDAFAAEHPEIYQQFLVTGAPVRRFLLKE